MKNKDRYPPDWIHIALEIKIKSKWKCERCGQPNNHDAGYTLTVHHIDGNPENNDRSNLIALCQRCHLKTQRNPRLLTPDPRQPRLPLF